MYKSRKSSILVISVVAIATTIAGATFVAQDGKRAPNGQERGKSGGDRDKAPPDGPFPGGPPGDVGFGGPGGPPGGFGPGGFIAPALMEKADADGDGKLTRDEAAKAAATLVRDADKDKKGSIDEKTFIRAVNLAAGPPPDFFPPDAEPGSFGPGTFLGPQVFKAADANNDGKLTLDEAMKAAEQFVSKNGKNDSLDEDTLAQAINRNAGPPQGFGPPGVGPGALGGPMGRDRKLLNKYDKDGNGRLDRQERAKARDEAKQQKRGGFGFGGPPPGAFGRDDEAEPTPGARIEREQVARYPDKSLYDPEIIRTLFLDFESDGWEDELADFYGSDVDVPAKLTVDGRDFPEVGVHFRGLSSYMMVRKGQKRSLNVSLDYREPDQRLDGYKTLNLLNAHEDPSLLHSVLYLQIARNYIPAPKANLVRVVINGEDWGLYANVQQFDKKFVSENFETDKGARWKVPGNPGARGGLEYIGEDIKEYKNRFEIKSNDDEKQWRALIELCRVLNETPPDQLEAALEPILDIDGVLWFLALDNALINNDGYWVRSSDYNIYRDPSGKFHVLPHDTNETFGPPMMMGGPMGGGRPEAGGEPAKKKGQGGRRMMFGPPTGPASAELDPLVGLDDPAKPLRSRLLAVPKLRQRYLDHVRAIARDWLDWQTLGPIVARYRTLMEPYAKVDTHKLMSTTAWEEATADSPMPKQEPAARGPRFGPPNMPLRTFADARRKYLLDYKGPKAADTSE